MFLQFEVLGWSASEVAELLETSVAAVNSTLQRARATLDSAPAPRPTEEEERVLLKRFVDAWDRVAIEGLVELLRKDAVLAMPPEPVLFSGRPQAVAEFFATVPGEGDLTRIKLVPYSSEPVARARRLLRRAGVRDHGLSSSGMPDRGDRRLRRLGEELRPVWLPERAEDLG
jgi:hypothetical protein